jgi:hypothetical protein
MKKVLLFLWQLPQNILALIIILLFIGERKTFDSLDIKYYILNKKKSFNIGVSLGDYILFDYSPSEYSIKHETGHQVQSRMFGWFYLIIIGIPSIIGNIIDRLFHKKWNIKKRFEWYYNLLWEKDANRRGGIIN